MILNFYSCSLTESPPKNDIVSQNTETRAGDPLEFPCDPCRDAILDYRTTTYNIEGCHITVHYTVENCPGYRMSVRDFSYTIGSGSVCYDVKKKWNIYFWANQTYQANLAMNEFYRTLTLLVQADVIAGMDPHNYPNGYVDFQWIETYCHTICAAKVLGEEGEPPIYWDLGSFNWTC